MASLFGRNWLTALVLLVFTIFSHAQVTNYAANGQNYFINPPIPVYGPGDYRGIRTYVTGQQFNVTWSKDQPYVWLVLAQEGNPNTRTLAANTSATYFLWDGSIQYQTSPTNQTFFLLLYDEPKLLYPYLAISQYFNITSPVSSSAASSATSATSTQSLNTAQQPTNTAATATTGSAVSQSTTSAASQATNTSSSKSSDSVPIGVGVGVGVGAALIIIAAAVWFFRRRSRKQKKMDRLSAGAQGYPMAPTNAGVGAAPMNGAPYTDYKPELASDTTYSNKYNNPANRQGYGPPRQEMP